MSDLCSWEDLGAGGGWALPGAMPWEGQSCPSVYYKVSFFSFIFIL